MSEASFIIALFLIELQCLEFLWRTNKKNRKKKRKHKKKPSTTANRRRKKIKLHYSNIGINRLLGFLLI